MLSHGLILEIILPCLTFSYALIVASILFRSQLSQRLTQICKSFRYFSRAFMGRDLD